MVHEEAGLALLFKGLHVFASYASSCFDLCSRAAADGRVLLTA